MRISDWSSDVCSSDLHEETLITPFREALYESLSAYLDRKRTDFHLRLRGDTRRLKDDAAPLLDRLVESLDLRHLDDVTDERLAGALAALPKEARRPLQIGRASWRERVCPYV